MRFKINFWQAIDWTSFFFIEKYVYHSQYISKFFFGLHNSFLILNYNNSFICIKRSLNFIESLILHRNNILAIGEFYNFFLKYIKVFKYFTLFNFKYLPDGFLTNFKNYFFKLKLSMFELNTNNIKLPMHYNSRFILDYEWPNMFEYQKGNSIRIKMTPPSAMILFNLNEKFWLINEIKILRLPLIGLVYPETELNSNLIHYPIPILHGLSKDLLLNYKDKEDISIFNKELNILVNKRKERKQKLKDDGFIVEKVKGLDFLKEYKEDPIHIFFLQLFLLTIYQSYKKLLLKFTNKTLYYLKNGFSNFKLFKYNSINILKYKISKKFYKKSFVKLYNILSTRIFLNSNLFFSNRNIKFIDRKLYLKKKKHIWSFKKIDWVLKKFYKFKAIIKYKQPLFWLQKKHLITFKGLNFIKKLKFQQTRFFPGLNTIINRNLFFKSKDRFIAFKSLVDNKFNKKKFKYNNNIISFFFKTINYNKLQFKSEFLNKNKKLSFFNYYSSRYWWIFKRPLLSLMQLKLKKKLDSFWYITKKGVLTLNRNEFYNDIVSNLNRDLSFRFLPLKYNKTLQYSFFFTHKDRLLWNMILKSNSFLNKNILNFFLIKNKNFFIYKTKDVISKYIKFLSISKKYNELLKNNYTWNIFRGQYFFWNFWNDDSYLDTNTLGVAKAATLSNRYIFKNKLKKLPSLYNILNKAILFYSVQNSLNFNFNQSGYFLYKTKYISNSISKNLKFQNYKKFIFIKSIKYLFNRQKLNNIPLFRLKKKNSKFNNIKYFNKLNKKFLLLKLKLKKKKKYNNNIYINMYNKRILIQSKYNFIKAYLLFLEQTKNINKYKNVLLFLKIALKSKNNLLINKLFLNLKNNLLINIKKFKTNKLYYKRKLHLHFKKDSQASIKFKYLNFKLLLRKKIRAKKKLNKNDNSIFKN